MPETLIVVPRSREKSPLDGETPWSYPSPLLTDRLSALRPYYDEIVLVAGHHGETTVHAGEDYRYYKIDTSGGRLRPKWRYARALIDAVRSAESPTVLNFDPNLTGALLGLLARLVGGRLVTKFIGLPGSDSDTLGKNRAGFWLLLRLSDTAVTVSPYCRDVLSDIYDRDISVVPNRISVEFDHSEVSRLDNSILYVGRFDEEKRIPLLIEAFAEVTSSRPDAELVLVGGDSERLRDKAAELGVAEQTRFTGRVPREVVMEWMSRATVFTLPTAEEAFGMVVLEAMACGTPVVGHDGGALPWLVDGGGTTVDVTDPEAYADALETVLGEESVRTRYEEAAVERAAEFTAETWGEDLYEAIRRE